MTKNTTMRDALVIEMLREKFAGPDADFWENAGQTMFPTYGKDGLSSDFAVYIERPGTLSPHPENELRINLMDTDDQITEKVSNAFAKFRTPEHLIAELERWKLDALQAMKLQDAALERLRKVLPAKYLGWNIWEAAADYIERSEGKVRDAA